jgi:hypothetical protein
MQPLLAEQEVTLKAGTRLIGSVRIDGETVVVKMGEAEITRPLGDVQLIASVGTDAKLPPERLLMIALESQLQRGTSDGLLGLLSEATRQAPDDPRIAYWYAQSLLDSGFGSEARRVFDSHRGGIERFYPGMAKQLSAHIQERIALENLPPKLVRRLDRLQASLDNPATEGDHIRMYVRFQLLDQKHQALDKETFRINCNGNNENLEGFENGHYLFSYNRYRNNDDNPCQLNVSWPGLEAKQLELRDASDQVADAGVFEVRRYDDTAKVPLAIVVADQSGKSLEGARVTLRAETQSGNSPAQTANTDADGRAEFRVFPMKYGYTAEAPGFKTTGASVEVAAVDKPAEPQRVALFPIITGQLRVEWITAAVQPGGAATTGETTLPLGEGSPAPNPYGNDAASFVRAAQVKDRMTLQFGMPYFGGPPGLMLATWVRRVPASEQAENLSPDQVAAKVFKNIDLKKIEKLRDQYPEPEYEPTSQRGLQGSLICQAKQSEIYIGQVTARDPRNGMPTLVSIKVLVEELTTGSPPR